jgi:acetyl esterase/lipase
MQAALTDEGSFILNSPISILLLAMFASLSFASEATFRDLEYVSITGFSGKLDLYHPANSDPAIIYPTIIWVHGGAWRSGSKNDVPILPLLKHGFAIASVDYRLSVQAPFPAQAHDIQAAIRFLRAKAEAYRLDRQRFIVAGASAGGHLAALVGVSANSTALEGSLGSFLEYDRSVQAIVSFYGASNLQTILSQSTKHGLSVRVPALQLFLGGQPEEKPDLASLASPISHVDRTDPPLWLIHGDADPQMPIEQSKELLRAYRELGLLASLDIIEGGKHGGPEFFEDQRLADLASQIKLKLR